MWHPLVIAVFLCTVAVPTPSATDVKGLMYMRQIGDKFDKFLSSDDRVKVVYFCEDFAKHKQFIVEMEKSAGIMELYDTEFALVDCSAHPNIGECKVPESEENVYIYRKNRLLVKVSSHSMFDIDSIVANVLQCVLLDEVPILQTAAERANLEAESKGHADVVYTYQSALGTHAHRIVMETMFAHRDEYRFGLTNEYKTVQDLPGYMMNEESAVWVLECKRMTDMSKRCPAMKYTGPMERNSLARYFNVRDLPAIHDVGRDGAFDPFTENDLHTVFVHYDANSRAAAEKIAADLAGAFLGQIGVILANVDEVAIDKAKFPMRRPLPAVYVQLINEAELRHMPDGAVPTQFVGEQLKSSMSEMSSDSSAEHDVLKQDDEVAELLSDLQKTDAFDDKNNVMHLNSTTFDAVTQQQQRTVMVLFYVTFDARSEVLRATYNELAKDLAAEGLHPLAAVDCFGWTDVCLLNNVSSYPLIRVYRPNVDPMRYSGYLSKAALYSAIKLQLAENPVLLHTASDVEEFVENCPPKDINANACVLGLYKSSDTAGIEKFDSIVAEMRGEIAFGRALDDNVVTAKCEKAGVSSPCILVVRRNDPVSSFSALSPEGCSKRVIESIRHARLPRLPELTAEQFAGYNALGRPFLISFINAGQMSSSKSPLLAVMEQLAGHMGPFYEKIVYAWMDVSKPDAVGSQILHHHVRNPRAEELLLINRDTGSVHHFEAASATVDAVLTWLQSTVSGDIMPMSRMSMEDWKPLVAPFNFLMYEDMRQTQRPASAKVAYANEHGVGVIDEEEVLPTRDIQDAVRSEVNRIQSVRQRAMKHSAKHSKHMHTEL